MTTTQAPDVLRVSCPRDLLALVPYQLGFTPEQSLVLLCLRGPRQRVGLVVRVDLPTLSGAERADLAAGRASAPLLERVRAHADRLARLAQDDGAAAVVAVVYDADPVHAAGPSGVVGDLAPARGDLAGLLEVVVGATCAARGIDLLDAWWVDGSRFACLTCEHPDCCPPGGRPVAELASSVMAAEMVARGAAPLPSRSQILDDLRPAGEPEVAVARRAATARRRRTRRAQDDPARAARLRAHALASLREVVAAPRLPTPTEAGGLAVSLADPWVRDAALLLCVAGAGDVPDRLALAGPDERTHDLLEGVVGGAAAEAAEPDRDALDALGRVLVDVVRHVPGRSGGQALALLAWMAWWSGEGARAVACAERVALTSPEVTLAGLVLDLVDAGVAPGWVRARRLDDVAAPSRRRAGAPGHPGQQRQGRPAGTSATGDG